MSDKISSAAAGSDKDDPASKAIKQQTKEQQEQAEAAQRKQQEIIDGLDELGGALDPEATFLDEMPVVDLGKNFDQVTPEVVLPDIDMPDLDTSYLGLGIDDTEYDASSTIDLPDVEAPVFDSITLPDVEAPVFDSEAIDISTEQSTTGLGNLDIESDDLSR